MSCFHILNMAVLSHTSSILHNDIGSYVGLYVRLLGLRFEGLFCIVSGVVLLSPELKTVQSFDRELQLRKPFCQ